MRSIVAVPIRYLPNSFSREMTSGSGYRTGCLPDQSRVVADSPAAKDAVRQLRPAAIPFISSRLVEFFIQAIICCGKIGNRQPRLLCPLTYVRGSFDLAGMRRLAAEENRLHKQHKDDPDNSH